MHAHTHRILAILVMALAPALLGAGKSPILLSPDGKMWAQSVSFENLARWPQDQQQHALAAFRRSCKVFKKGHQTKQRAGFTGRYKDWATVCAKADRTPLNRMAARHYFEENFQAARLIKVGDKGLFTGYFEPAYTASLTRSKRYNVPLYRKPKNHKKASRADIENGALKNRGLDFVYLQSPVDAFFLHIQGSGRLFLDNGKMLRVGFEAKNGHAYTAIGKPLMDQGEIARKDMSMQSIRRWLEDNPRRGRRLMLQNASFIFFKPLKNLSAKLGPIGAQGIALTPQRSLAIDKARHGLGMPLWLETTIPDPQNRASKPFHHLMVAQDTGSAIKGIVRGDIFWGSGSAAGEIAGNLKQVGKLYILLPRPLAKKFEAH